MTPAERIPIFGFCQGLIESLRPWYARALFVSAFGSATAILFSIAISQILLGFGLLLILLGRPPVYFPPIKLPLMLFLIATILADVLSVDPWGGIPQIKKFFVFGIVLLVSCAFRNVAQFTNLLISWV